MRLLFFIAFLLSFCIRCYAQNEMYDKAQSVVTIYACCKNGRSSVVSGVLIDSTGIVLTNSHVVPPERKYSIKLGSQTYLLQKVIYRDALHDFALLQTNYRSTRYISLGNSDDAKVEDEVFAIGSPGDMRGTFTKGIISAPKRFVKQIKMLQHTANISQGSSGGPLLNARGELIGINTLELTESQEINFAIPINDIVASIPEKVIKSNELRQKMLLARARQALSNLKYKAAIARCNEALNLIPESLEAIVLKAIVYSSADSLDAAEELLKCIMPILQQDSLHQNSYSSACTELAEIYWKKGEALPLVIDTTINDSTSILCTRNHYYYDSVITAANNARDAN